MQEPRLILRHAFKNGNKTTRFVSSIYYQLDLVGALAVESPSSASLLQARVQCVPEPIPKQVKPEHGQ